MSLCRASVCDRESAVPLSALRMESFTSDSRASSFSISADLVCSSCGGGERQLVGVHRSYQVRLEDGGEMRRSKV